MAQEQQGMAEQAINKAAEMGLASQLDEVEKLEVAVDTDPGKLIQGQLDSVEVKGEGLVMQQHLRMEELDMQMNQISINPLSVAFGKIELTRPTDASARVVLTEADVNQAFNSEYISQMLQNQEVKVDGKSTIIDTKKVDFRLPGDGKVGLSAQVFLHQTNQNQQVSFTAVPHISADGQSVKLENIQYTDGKEISPELTDALIEKASDILNFSNFDLKGISFRLKSLNVEAGKMTLFADARVEQIPS